MDKNISVTKSKKNIMYPQKNNLLEYSGEIYSMIENGFKLLNMDKKNTDTSDWNPLNEIIKPGDYVLIKPNMVLERNMGNNGEDCLYTNPSIVKCIIDYAVKALDGSGRIVVADAPVQQCNFDKLIEESGYKDLINYYKNNNINIELKDMRGLISTKENGNLIQKKINSPGKVINLGTNSEHYEEKDDNRVRITNYDPSELLKHHCGKTHEYYISDELLKADVVINIPKPKSHRKAGITIAMKNFVGVNVRKEFLPHHKYGSKRNGGDEYKSNSILLRISSRLIDLSNNNLSKNRKNKKIFSKIARVISGFDKRFISRDKTREGSWYGNDTIWRTIADINKIVYFADKNGNMKNNIQRKVFNIADMIIVGEKEGPLLPSPKYFGTIVMGEDIYQFDLVCATLLGIDKNKVPLYKNITKIKKYKYFDDSDKYMIKSNCKEYNDKLYNEILKDNTANIIPSEGWKGHIELDD